MAVVKRRSTAAPAQSRRMSSSNSLRPKISRSLAAGFQPSGDDPASKKMRGGAGDVLKVGLFRGARKATVNTVKLGPQRRRLRFRGDDDGRLRLHGGGASSALAGGGHAVTATCGNHCPKVGLTGFVSC